MTEINTLTEAQTMDLTFTNAIQRGMCFTDGEKTMQRFAVIHEYMPAYTDAWGSIVKAGVRFALIRTYASPEPRWSMHTWNVEDFVEVFQPMPEE